MATFHIHEDSAQIEKTKCNENKLKNINRKRKALEPIKSSYDDYVSDAKREKLESFEVPTSKIDSNEKEKEKQELSLTSSSFICRRSEVKEKFCQLKIAADETLHWPIEYEKDFWPYLLDLERRMEWPKANYMRKQEDLEFSMRSVVIDWLVDVAIEYEMNDQTIHLAVNYIDRFLSRMSVVRNKFQLLGAVAMMVASKIEEVYPPVLNEWVYLTKESYTISHVVRMEQLLLKVLRFELQPPTICAFIHQFCADNDLNNQIKHLAMYLSELILLEGDEYLAYLPSQLATAAIMLAKFTVSSNKELWPTKMRHATDYTLQELSPIIKRLNVTFRDSPIKSEQAVQSKYQDAKYEKVSTIKPKRLILNFTEEQD